jgi:MmpS family membrane protein
MMIAMRRLIPAVIAAVSVALSVAACASPPAAAPEPVVIPAASFKLDNAPIPVKFEVKGGKEAQIVYGPPESRITAPLPWTLTLDSLKSEVVMQTTLIARSTSPDATITCRISVGGTTIREKTARGTADCSPLWTSAPAP